MSRAQSSAEQIPVLVVGGGPVGLTLALTLAQQGVAAILVERNPSTTTHPKMDITNGRGSPTSLSTPSLPRQPNAKCRSGSSISATIMSAGCMSAILC
jgi:thioredoxin reductase